ILSALSYLAAAVLVVATTPVQFQGGSDNLINTLKIGPVTVGTGMAFILGTAFLVAKATAYVREIVLESTAAKEDALGHLDRFRSLLNETQEVANRLGGAVRHMDEI